MGEWYYDTRTGEAVEGKQPGYLDRMGPYPTREAALEALQTAANRNDSWDEEDQE